MNFICYDCILLPSCSEYCDKALIDNLSIFYHSGHCPDCSNLDFKWVYIARSAYFECIHCKSAFIAENPGIFEIREHKVSHTFRATTYKGYVSIMISKLGKFKMPEFDMEPKSISGPELKSIIKKEL